METLSTFIQTVAALVVAYYLSTWIDGKVGKGSHTYLMSPMTAMATAVRGYITDPRERLG